MFALLWALDYRLRPSLVGDGVDYAWAARNLAAGRYQNVFASQRPPLFPALIAFVSSVTFREPSVALRIVTFLSGLMVIALTWRLVRALTKDPVPSWLAAAMAAVGMPAICGLYFSHSPDCLGLCFVIAGIMASAAAAAGCSAAQAAAAGLVWSLAALTRTQYLPLGPAALLLFIHQDAGWRPWSARRARPRSFGAPLWFRALCFLAGWLIPLMAYYALLSLDAHQVTITNAYDAANTMAFYAGRPYAVARSLISSLLTGLPLLVLAGIHLRAAPPRLPLLGKATGLILPWIKLAGILTLMVCLASWPQRRYFLAAHWCVWTLAAIAYAARREAERRSSLTPRLQTISFACLALAAASYPVSAWLRNDEWPPPTPAYRAASHWVNATFGAGARVAVTGGRETIRYDVQTNDLLPADVGLRGDWSALRQWLQAKRPDVVLIGPDAHRERHYPLFPLHRILLDSPRLGRRGGLVYDGSFRAPEGIVNAFIPEREASSARRR